MPHDLTCERSPMAVIAMPPRPTLRAYGAIAELARMRDPRILVEGPADTGKTSGILRVEELWAWSCPGIRVLLVRQTMQSLRESVLVTLEDKVWGPMLGGRRHPAQHGTATRATRRTYNFPNGSTYVIGGLEDPAWTFSMEYDDILGFEAWEFSKDSIEKLYRANRNHVKCRYAEWNQGLAELVGRDWSDEHWLEWHGTRTPEGLAKAPPEVRAALCRPEGFGCWQSIILDTNPHGEFHQLNQMAAPIGGQEIARIKSEELPSRRVFRSPDHPFVRVLSRHVDNPACTEDDLAKLRAQTGHRRSNLYLGLWTSAEGQIWPTFDPTIHMLSAVVEVDRDKSGKEVERDPNAKTDTRAKYLRFLGDRGPHLPESVEIKWTFASQDLGFRNAGCLQVWAVDYDDRIYRLVEIHKREMLDDWWTDCFMELWQEFDLYEGVFDCEDPERIVKVGDRLEAKGAHNIARGVDKSVRRGNRTKFVPTSLDLVRELLEPSQPGGPRMYWIRDALRGGPDPKRPGERLPARCPISTDHRWPCSSEEEIPSFTFEAREDGKPDDEEPAKACKQDGCAATRYAAVYKWLMDPRGPKTAERFPVGTAGWRLGHAEVLERSKEWVR